MCIIILSWLSWERTKCRINVINIALCATEVKKVEQIYSDLDNHWCLAFFLLITSGKDPWAGPANISSLTRPLSAILCAAPRQPSGSGFDIFVPLDSVWAADNLLACFRRILWLLLNRYPSSWGLSELLVMHTLAETTWRCTRWWLQSSAVMPGWSFHPLS